MVVGVVGGVAPPIAFVLAKLRGRMGLALLLACCPAVTLAQELSPEALARVTAATVFVRCSYAASAEPDAPEALVGSGSGFFVSDAGLVITNHHVVAPVLEQGGRRYVLREISVHVGCGTPERKAYPASVLAAYELPVDLALLRVRADERFPSLQADSAWVGAHDLALTQPVWAVGFPLGESMEEALAGADMSRNPNGPDISVRPGSVTALRKDAQGGLKAVEHSCNIEHGNSGGPLINRAGLVVGVNALGIERTAFAIPQRLVRERFARVLAWTGDGKLVDTHARRLLRVDPTARATATSFQSITAAFAAARAGDTVELAAGRFELDAPLRIPGRCWIRGAGREHTTLVAAADSWLGVEVGAGGDYTELSDMRIESSLGTALAVRETACSETFLHDLDLWGMGAKTLLVESGGSPSFVACRIADGCLVKGPSGRSRFLRCAFNELRLEAGRADLSGCTWLLQGALSAEGAEVTLSDTVMFGATLKDTQAGFKDCTIRAPNALVRDRAVRLEGDSTLEVQGGSSRLAPYVLAGPGVRGRFTRSHFFGETGPGVIVRDGAGAALSECLFTQEPPSGAVVPGNDRSRDANFGLWIRGAACRVSLTGCAFESPLGGVAILLAESAQVDQAGSRFSGVSVQVATE